MKITHLPTTEITIHAAAQHIPGPDMDSPEFRALLAVLAETGQPIRAVGVNAFRAITNLDVLLAAKQLGMTTVPTIEVEKHDIDLTILGELLGRKHYTKSQLAWLALPFLKSLVESSKSRRIANLKKGPQSSQVVDFPERAQNPIGEIKTLEQASEMMGVARRLLLQAGEIQRRIEANPELEKKAMELIFGKDNEDSGTCLGYVINGLSGKESTEGQPKVVQMPLLLWTGRIEQMCAPKRWVGWDRVPEPARYEIAEKFWNELLSTVPDEIRNACPHVNSARRNA